MKYQVEQELKFEKETLVIKDIHYNKLKCYCNKCNMEGIYTEKELDSGEGCKYCREFERAAKEIKITTEMKSCDAIIKRTETRANTSDGLPKAGQLVYSLYSNCKGLQVGQLFNDLVLSKFVSKIVGGGASKSLSTPTHAILVCRYCGHYKRLLTIEELLQYNSTESQREKYKCPHCSNIVEKAKTELKEYSSNRLKQKTNRIIKKEAKQAAITTESGSNKLLAISSSTSKSAKVKQIMEKAKKKNPFVTIRDVEKIGSGYAIHCTCDICGTDIVIPSSSKSKKAECPGCKKKETDINYIGRFNKDYTGVTKNLLTLISRNGDNCELECVTCKNKHKDIKFYDWYTNKTICQCRNNETDASCKNCGKPINIPYKNIINAENKNTEITCPGCGEPSGVTLQQLQDEFITAESDKITQIKKMGVARKELKNNIVQLTRSFFKCKEPLYVGTDNKFYYKCMCLEHDTFLVLNDDEISVFNHEQCEEARQHIMKDVTKDNIKF